MTGPGRVLGAFVHRLARGGRCFIRNIRFGFALLCTLFFLHLESACWPEIMVESNISVQLCGLVVKREMSINCFGIIRFA